MFSGSLTFQSRNLGVALGTNLMFEYMLGISDDRWRRDLEAVEAAVVGWKDGRLPTTGRRQWRGSRQRWFPNTANENVSRVSPAKEAAGRLEPQLMNPAQIHCFTKRSIDQDLCSATIDSEIWDSTAW